MKIGYIRVSTEEQNTARQEVLLRELGVDEVFIDKASGKNADRPELTDAALLENIEKDGICLLDRYHTKFENFTNAVERLREGVQAYQENPAKIIRDGVIQRFEFTCELAWKTTREFLLDQGFTELNSPKATMRKAFSYGLIDDEQAWIALLNARNQTSHIYDDATAQEIYSQIESEFVSLFDKLIEQLKCG